MTAPGASKSSDRYQLRLMLCPTPGTSLWRWWWGLGEELVLSLRRWAQGSWGAAIPLPGSIQMAVWTKRTGETLWTGGWMVSYWYWLSQGKLARSQTQLSIAQQHQTVTERGSINLCLLESNSAPSWLHSLWAKVSQTPLRPLARWRRPSAVGLPPHDWVLCHFVLMFACPGWPTQEHAHGHLPHLDLLTWWETRNPPAALLLIKRR